MRSEWLQKDGSLHELATLVVKAVHAHGGDDNAARRILKDPVLLAEIAKKVVGPIWEIVGKRYPLEVDWMSLLGQFVGDMSGKGLRLDSGSFNNTGVTQPRYEDEKPLVPYDLCLVHYEEPVSPDAVMEAHTVAGFRDLCTFLCDVPIPPGTDILALGSSRTYETGARRTFVHGRVTLFDQHREVVWINGLYHYDPQYFFLVRIPR